MMPVSDNAHLFNLPRWLLAILAALSCAALFAIATLFPAFYLLTWVAFVPFLFGLQLCRSTWQAYGFGLLTGFLLFAFSAYWMTEFIRLFREYSIIHSVSLASLYWFYCAQLFAFVAALTHYAQRGNAILWVFPTLLALAVAFFPTLFPWQIGNTQSQFLVAIQATDIAGVSGLDFMVGLVNVLVAQVLFGTSDFSSPVFFQRSAIAAYALIVIWFGYGVFSLNYWDKAIANWHTLAVGVVQPDEPPIIGTPDPRPGYSLSYPLEMDLTEQLAANGAEVVIWPELRNKQFYTRPFVEAAYRRQIANLQTPLLFQSYEPLGREDDALSFNAATLLGSNGEQLGKYQKMKRIPLAEYLPVFEHSKTIEIWLRRTLGLGEFFGSYSAGAAPQRFDLGKASIQPFICFEIIFPGFVASSTRATDGDILTVQSNNGWFGDTRAPLLHMDASILRGVENRRPMVHVMNNGLGGVSLPSGRILLRTDHNEIAGYLVDVPYRENGFTTFYSRFPYWLLSVLALALVVMLIRTGRSKQKPR